MLHCYKYVLYSEHFFPVIFKSSHQLFNISTLFKENLKKFHTYEDYSWRVLFLKSILLICVLIKNNNMLLKWF